MSLRAKVILLLLGVFFVSMIAEIAVQRLAVFPSFVELEREEALKDLERCSEALEREIEHLMVFTGDWAAWDDTYDYAQDRNADYEEANLLEETFEGGDLNLIYIVNNDGEVVWGAAYDLPSLEPVELDWFPAASFSTDHPLLQFDSLEDELSGLLMTDHGPLLVASHPILTSEDRGPIRGAFVMGRFLTDDAVADLAEQTQVNFRLWPIDSESMEAADRTAIGGISAETPVIIEQVSDAQLVVYSTFADILGEPALLMRVNVPRDISRRGGGAMLFASVSLIAASLCVLLALMVLLQRVVIGPIVRLTSHATAIGESGDLSLSTGMERSDEIGLLAVEFDNMTRKLEQSRTQLVDLSRQAGMSEVATGVLHNIGNVLTGMSVSTSQALEKTQKLNVPDVVAMAELLGKHEDDLGAFITTDKKGKLIPKFLGQVGENLNAQRKVILDELESVGQSLNHITDIVRMQQSYAKVNGVMEKVRPIDLANDALRINSASLKNTDVEIVRKFGEVPPITTDRHTVLQILVNVLNNALWAVSETDSAGKRITIRIGLAPDGDDRLQIIVSDNGVGIAPENLTRVFSYGFSTRSDGNGFGLHTGALDAKALGGSLNGASEGPGKGATFTLELPINPTVK